MYTRNHDLDLPHAGTDLHGNQGRLLEGVDQYVVSRVVITEDSRLTEDPDNTFVGDTRYGVHL